MARINYARLLFRVPFTEKFRATEGKIKNTKRNRRKKGIYSEFTSLEIIGTLDNQDREMIILVPSIL